MKITVIGAGYVGLSLAVLLSSKNEVSLLEIVPEKVSLINDGVSPIRDEYIEKYLQTKKLNLVATTDKNEAISGARFVVICTPTNYDDEKNFFDTSSVEDSIKNVQDINPGATIIIKSTIPVGFTESMRKKFGTDEIFFSPEFLREGKALYDNLYPSRIIVGGVNETAQSFANLLLESAEKKDTEILLMSSTEAETVKLFANTFLAMRVAFFNELDTYAEINGLNTKNIIDGVSLDPRIGNYYNNPSFGYGGYCLPKDTKQLLANYGDIPQNLTTAIIEANITRKQHIANMILLRKPKTVGIYRLTMKSGSDNFRSSAIQDIINILSDRGAEIVIFEPTIDDGHFKNFKVINDFSKFREVSDIILANRLDDNLMQVKEKVYTRDIFSRD